jgi:alpha(1,3/1,4) fucosyltransferase
MKTIRITRQGFPNHGQHSWMNYFKFILSKKYNVIIDSENPDLVIHSDLHYNSDQIDTYTGKLPTTFTNQDKNKKFIYVSGEVANFKGPIDSAENQWAMGYNKFDHPRYLRQPSCAFDVWTLFDESRLTDSPLNWLTEKRNFDLIKNRNTRFCSITQASNNEFRGLVLDKLNEYKEVTSSGPWRQNIDPSEELNKYQWMNPIYIGRNDGLTYREKINFFNKFKFNMSIHYTNTDYILQEKIFHGYFSGAIPIFFGNQFILEEGFNPNSFINLHDYPNLDDFLGLIKEIDNNEDLWRKYIEEPIYVDNKLPQYFDFDYTLNFLEKIIEA